MRPADAIPELMIHNPTRGTTEHELTWLRWHEHTLTAEGMVAAPPEALIGLPVVARIFDQGRRAQLEWEFRQHGYDASRSAIAPITVEIDHRGLARLLDGTHRVYAAAAAGLPTVPTRLRYLGGSEMLATSWQPRVLARRGGASASPPAGLVGRYVANDLVLLDGAAVATWPDSSGIGNDLAQATSVNRPIFKAGALNGQGIVRFTAAAASYIFRDPLVSVIAQPNTIVTVIRPTMTGAFLLGTSVTAVDNFEAIEALIDNGLPSYASQAQAPPGNVEMRGPDQAWSWLVASFNGASSDLFVSNGQVGRISSMASNAAALGRLTLGRVGTAAGSFATMDIAEVLLYARVLTTAERLQLAAYVYVRYGL